MASEHSPDLNWDEILVRYQNGESITKLTKAYSVSKDVIHRILRLSDVHIRNLQEACALQRQDPFMRYEQYVDRSNISGCHPWTGPLDGKGYGRLVVNRKGVAAHRFGYLNLVGPIPPGTPHVLHKCDNPPCNNPDHWFLGTHADNMADKMKKGRGVPPPHYKGEHHPQAKLTRAEVNAIRTQHALGNSSMAELARRYNVSPPNIRRIVLRRIWV